MWGGNMLPGGAECPPEAEVIWGARALYEGGACNLLGDRQGWHPVFGGTAEQRRSFWDWLRSTGLPALRRWIRERGVESNSAAIFEFSDGQHHLRASPNQSYGYVYIAAWRLK